MWSTIRISALLWADLLVSYELFVMQNYLTDVWGLSVAHAAAILNIWDGISLVLQPLFLVLVNTILGNFRMLMISSTAYSLGIFFVFMSAPPVLANSTGTCKQYEKECIGQTQKALFYAGMALLAVGIAGNKISGKPFLKQQPDYHDDSMVIGCLKRRGMLMVAILGMAVAFPLSYIPWTFIFGILALCTAAAFFSFLTGLRYYRFNIKGPQREHNVTKMISPQTFSMVITFVVCGMVSSVGNTYFVHQASNLNRNIGKWKVPTQVLLLAQNFPGMLLGLLAGKINDRKQFYTVFIAMIFAVLCCITAAVFEKKRLNIVRSHGLLDKPDEAIPMSVYWLFFQFVLLGGLNTMLKMSVAAFKEDESERRSLEVYTRGLSGFGYMSSVLSAYVAGQKSAKGGAPGWFQLTLNRSRLDKYYWMLSILTYVSLVAVVVSYLCCRFRSKY